MGPRPHGHAVHDLRHHLFRHQASRLFLRPSTCTPIPTSPTHDLKQHHCRNCGKVVCGACSSQKVVIPGLDMQKAERVCSQCFDAISKELHAQGDAPASAATPPAVAAATTAASAPAPAAPDAARAPSRRALRRVISTSFDDAPDTPPTPSTPIVVSPDISRRP